MDETTGGQMDIEPSLYDEDFDISVAVDPVSGRVPILYTNGLEDLGFPELAIEPSWWFEPPHGMPWSEFSHFLAQVLWNLATAFLDARGSEMLYLTTNCRGQDVTFWCTEEPPEGPVTSRFDEDFGEMYEVRCSLWSEHPPVIETSGG